MNSGTPVDALSVRKSKTTHHPPPPRILLHLRSTVSIKCQLVNRNCVLRTRSHLSMLALGFNGDFLWTARRIGSWACLKNPTFVLMPFRCHAPTRFRTGTTFLFNVMSDQMVIYATLYLQPLLTVKCTFSAYMCANASDLVPKLVPRCLHSRGNAL